MRKKIAIGIFLLICLLPLLLGLGYSLLYSLGMAGLFGKGFTLEYWSRLFSNPETLGSLGYTLYLSLASMLLILGLTLLYSWVSFRKGTSKVNQQLLFFPLLFAPVVAAFAFFYLMSPGGIFSRLAFILGWIEGLEEFPRWINDKWGIGILMVHVFLIFPLFTLLFLNQIKKQRMHDLADISFTLGSSPGQFFWRIFAPTLVKGSAAFILLYAIFLFGAYEVPMLLGRSSPRTVSLYITENMGGYDLQKIPLAHAMAVVFSILVMLISRLFMPKDSSKMLGI